MFEEAEATYVKVVVEGEISCFIHADHFPVFFKSYVQTPRQRKMIEHSDIVIDLQSNTIIKTRYMLDDLFTNGFPRAALTIKFSGVV